jgi:NAD(P)-dependent dehydrogenase (short-subunit alcohol dehydrogenase family)
MISGGSRGLGAALVQQSLAAGWQVHDFSRSGGNLPGLVHHATDLARLDEEWPTIDSAMQALAAQSWQQVVFVSNAGQITPIGPVAGLADADIVASLQINLLSAIRLMAGFVRHFQALAASKILVSISSGAAKGGYDGWSLYCAAKAGLENFINSLALEQGRAAQPISCFNFGPGVIDTDMQVAVRSSDVHSFPNLERFVALKDQGQLRTPESVARVLFDLCQQAPENGRRYTVDEFDAR